MADVAQSEFLTFEHGGRSIAYAVRPSRGRAIRIVVRNADEVEVRAPARLPAARVHDFVVRQAGWIASALARQAARPRLTPRSYRDGETFYVLGRPLRLEVARGVWARARQEDGALRVTLGDPANAKRVRELVSAWFRQEAERHLPECLAEALERYRMFIRPACGPLALRSEACPGGLRLTVREMKTRWGSCSPDGHITLSLELMHVPRRLIDYVIVHELCHLVRLDHSRAFYFQVARCLPDWRERRQALESRSWCLPQGGTP